MELTLALGGGGAKGNSHIGVLRRLEKEGFKIRAVAGTSFGGIVAVMYAAGYAPNEIEDIFAKVDQTRLYGRLPEEKPSLLGLAGVRKWLDEVLPGRTFADLKIPCAVTAVDLNCGCEVILDDGPVKDALLATIAVPGIFPACPWHEWELPRWVSPLVPWACLSPADYPNRSSTAWRTFAMPRPSTYSCAPWMWVTVLWLSTGWRSTSRMWSSALKYPISNC
jgi:hypothetical protein